MDALVGRKLVKAERLGWCLAGKPDDLSAGPVHLVFEGGQGILLDGQSDWSLKLMETYPEDRTWLDAYDYDWEGARWLLRDASSEPPFAAVMARHLVALEPTYNEVNEMTGLSLNFDGHPLTLKTREGEVVT
ncbi:hypothetical protein BJ973_001076 [Actinoplanes tereljensis]|uniref:Uncharacterized protein n=1 Tax=Paractinoplanes tereljensis TaxID=571912 RepID=A0A919TXR9_9ACTN|nr:hypothetical protein [Actinoplanes tereljensis]GIF26631.1 hypothetical protein Ate02nite_93610 [Actinoplanes tereljensis]